MASIFLSYARDDLAKAEPLATALEGAGHDVWWDRRIHAGSRFSAEIDRALKTAELVVVLWSRSSLDSAWVHDEAAFGRDHGRLVPVLIDKVEPPLGFRQFQSVDLARQGRSGARALVEAVAERLGTTAQAPAFKAPSSFRWKLALPAVAAALVIVALAWFFSAQQVAPRSVGIAASGGDPARSNELAQAISLDLGRYRTGQLGSLTFMPASSDVAERAEFLVEVAVSGGSSDARADLSLRQRGGSSLLWSSSLEAPGRRFVDLRQQATSALASVLECLGEVEQGKTRLGTESLSLYLDGCGKLADHNTAEPGAELFGVFRRLTQEAPGFAPGWARLALLEAQSFPSVPSRDWHKLAQSARMHLRRAKQTDPELPVVVAAEAYLPENYLAPGKALAIVERGLANSPESALLHSARADFLARVGRIGEAVKEAKAALDLDPLSPAAHDTYASALAYSGRAENAFDALRKAEAIWPGSTVLEQARYRLDLRYGDPGNALRLLDRRVSGDVSPFAQGDAWQRFLQARIAPTPGNVDKALQAFRDRAKDQRGDWGYFQALGTFGRTDEAFRAMDSPEVLDGLSGSPDAFFRVHMRPIYSDPRFLGVAQGLGLLSYWKKSGVWPDFCRDPALPYDCRKEAAKYR